MRIEGFSSQNGHLFHLGWKVGTRVRGRRFDRVASNLPKMAMDVAAMGPASSLERITLCFSQSSCGWWEAPTIRMVMNLAFFIRETCDAKKPLLWNHRGSIINLPWD